MTAAERKHQLAPLLLQIADELKCSICLCSFERPQLTPCQHTFCQLCINAALQRTPHCPLCKCPVTKRSLVDDERTQQITDRYRRMHEAFERLFDISCSQMVWADRRQTMHGSVEWHGEPLVDLSQAVPYPEKEVIENNKEIKQKENKEIKKQEYQTASMSPGTVALGEAVQPAATEDASMDLDLNSELPFTLDSTLAILSPQKLEQVQKMRMDIERELQQLDQELRGHLDSGNTVVANQENVPMQRLDDHETNQEDQHHHLQPKYEDRIPSPEFSQVPGGGGSKHVATDRIHQSTTAERSTPKLPRLNRHRIHQKQPLCFLTSSLSKAQQTRLQMLATRHGIPVRSSYSSQVTHLITVTEVGPAQNRRSKRTFKYFQCIADGKWIVDFAWIEECSKVGKMVDPSPFEVHGDTDMPSKDGPRWSRLSHEQQDPLLFHEFTFFFDGHYRSLSKEQAMTLAKQCGADIRQEPHPEFIPTPEHYFVICGLETDLEAVRYHGLHGRCLVSVTWLLDSISTYEIQPVDSYLLR